MPRRIATLLMLAAVFLSAVPISSAQSPPTPGGPPTDAVSTAEELDAWFEAHRGEGGAVSLSADLSVGGTLLLLNAAEDVEIDAGPHTVFVAPGGLLRLGGGVRLTGGGTVCSVAQGGALILEGGSISAEGPGARAVLTEAPDGLSVSYTSSLTAAGPGAVALDAPAGAELSHVSLSATGQGATAMRSGGGADLTYCSVTASGQDAQSISTQGVVLLDASYASPPCLDARIVERSAPPPAPRQLFMDVGEPYALPEALPYTLTAPGRPDLRLTLPLTGWTIPEIPDREGVYRVTARPMPPDPLIPLPLPREAVFLCYAFDPAQPRLTGSSALGGMTRLTFYKPYSAQDWRLWYSPDEGRTWTELDGDVQYGYTGVLLRFPLPLGPHLFQLEDRRADGTVLESNILRVEQLADGTQLPSQWDGDRDGGDREEQPSQPPPFEAPGGADGDDPPPPEPPPRPEHALRVPLRPPRLSSSLLPAPSPLPGSETAEAAAPAALTDPFPAQPPPENQPELPAVTREPSPGPEARPSPSPDASPSPAVPERSPPGDPGPPPKSAALPLSAALTALPLLLLLTFASGRRGGRRWLTVFCLSAFLLGVLLFLLKVQFDNKYTRPGPQAQAGVLTLDETALTRYPLFFLTDGWAFYQYQSLTPEDFQSGAPPPTAYLTLGRYQGFELDDPGASPYGAATYRLILRVPEEVRRYALEVPEVYGDYRLWVNGKPELDAGGAQAPAGTALTFRASGRVELILAVENHSGPYSGLTHPPAFGAPQAVQGLLSLRLILSAAACALALALAALYLAVGLRTGRARTALAFCLLCLAYAASLSRAAVHALGLAWAGWYTVERVGYYAVYPALLLILGHVCRMPRLWRRVTGYLAGFMCLIMLAFQLLPPVGLDAMLLLSRVIEVYKYAAAACLLLSALWAALRGQVYARPLLAGSCVFAAALVVDRAYRAYEPVLLSWTAESAAGIQVFLTAAVLVADTAALYREKTRLAARDLAAAELIASQTMQYHALAGQLDRFAAARHELRGLLLAMREDCRTGRYERLPPRIDRYLGDTGPILAFSRNSIVNAILSALFHDMERSGLRVEHDVGPLPRRLSIEDVDLCSLLTNVLQNAIDACGRMPGGADRWVRLSLRYQNKQLYLTCSNSCAGRARRAGGGFVSPKREWGHGRGLAQIRSIVEKYGGFWEAEPGQNAFSLSAALPDRAKEEKTAPPG